MLDVQESPRLAPQGPEDIESGMPPIPEGHEGASPSSTDGLVDKAQNPGTPRTPTQWKGKLKPKRKAAKPTGPRFFLMLPCALCMSLTFSRNTRCRTNNAHETAEIYQIPAGKSKNQNAGEAMPYELQMMCACFSTGVLCVGSYSKDVLVSTSGIMIHCAACKYTSADA